MTDPIPTKFEEQDKEWIDKFVLQSGLKRSEVIRRSVRALAIAAKRCPQWNWVMDTSLPISIHSETPEERRGMLAMAMDDAAAKVEKQHVKKWKRDRAASKRSA